MPLIEALLWETVQNLPLIAGFFLGLGLWQRGAHAGALLLALGGSALSALLIETTEGRLFAGFRPSAHSALRNALIFAVLTLLSFLYLGAPFSGYASDGAVGGLIGLALARLQKPRGALSLRRALSLVAGAIGSLWLIRWLAALAPWIAFAAVIACFSLAQALYKAHKRAAQGG